MNFVCEMGLSKGRSEYITRLYSALIRNFGKYCPSGCLRCNSVCEFQNVLDCWMKKLYRI